MATTAKDWKNRANKATDLDLPSGNVALVRNPGMQVFLSAGIIPNSLLEIILNAIEGDNMPDLQKMATNPDQLADVLKLVDAVTVYCVVEPGVSEAPEAGEPRDEDLLYVDEVDLNDKMFIFQFAVGGTRDLERFRESTESAMVDVRREPELAVPTKRAARPRK